MSYFNIDENNISTDEKIKYTYSAFSVNHRDTIERSNDDNLNSIKKKNSPKTEGDLIPIKNTFYEIKLKNREPNFIYAGLSPSSYTSKSIYLFGLLHRNIAGITSGKKGSEIVGEIVVEHTNHNKQLQKVYTCFLIKQEDTGKLKSGEEGSTNTLDSLIPLINNELQPEQQFDLSSVIPTQTHAIHYTDAENHIFVFTIPITINKSTVEFFKKLAIKTTLFNIYPTNENSNKTMVHGSETILLQPKTDKKEGFQLLEGFDPNDIYIDCTTNGESDEQITGYNVPINSEYSNNKHQIDVFKMITHFFIFIFILAISFFTIPSLYKTIVVDFFNVMDADTIKSFFGDTLDITKKQIMIHSADRLITIVFITLILVAFLWTPIMMYYGMFISGFAVAGYSLIQFNKTQQDFMSTPNTSGGIENSSYDKNAPFTPDDFKISYMFRLFVGLITALFKGNSAIEHKIIPYLAVAAASFFIIQTILWLAFTELDKDNNDIGFFYGYQHSLFISLLVISPIFNIISSI